MPVGLPPLELPDSYSRLPRRLVSVFLGLLRIALALATIPLAMESVKQGNFPGDRSMKYVSFYWTEAVVTYYLI